MSLETSSHGQRKPPFPLLRLPYELLDTIFEFAYEEADRPEPVCRALRQFAEKRLWRDPVIKTYRSLARFCRVVNSGSRLAMHVQSLNLDFGDCEDDNSTGNGNGTSRRLVGAKSFSKTLSRLDRLQCLRMVDLDDNLARVLSSADLDISALPQLRSIDVDQFTSVPIDRTIWTRRLATLREIRLSKPAYLPLLGTPMQASKLVLQGIYLHSWNRYNYATAFPALRSFAARDKSVESQFPTIVSQLPRDLKELRLESAHASPRTHPGGSLDDILHRFVLLESLYLCSGTFTLPRLRAFLDTASNLVSLGFGLNSSVTDDFLLSLVEGPTLLRHLRTLELDYVRCGRGLTMKSQDYRLSEDANITLFHTYPGWWGPKWPRHCTHLGLLLVVHGARRAGISVTGTALAARGWEDDYNCEIYDALMAWGLEVDDFEEAREFFGDDVVREFQSMMYSFM